MKQMSIREIAEHVNGRIAGNADAMITGLEEIELAESGQLTFIGSSRYLKFWPDSGASAVLVDEGMEISPGDRTVIYVESADLAIAPLLDLFAPPPPSFEAGIHSTAVIDSGADLGKNVSIGAGCYIGPGVKIGDDSLLYPNVCVMDESAIGKRTTLWPGVVVREQCHIGDDCVLFPNVVIGSDGFGFRPSPDGKSQVKIPQIGRVSIGNRVEIGAGSCIDRAKFSLTIVGDGTKIDNMVQIGHNCRIGRSCVICGCASIAGSSILGDNVIIGGKATLKDHVNVGDRAMIVGGSLVLTDVEPGVHISGYPAAPHKTTLQQWAAIRKLPEFLKKFNPAK